MRGLFGAMVRGVSNPREGPKILFFLFGPDWCADLSYISEARGWWILRSSSLRSSKMLAAKNSHLAYDLACLGIEKMAMWHIGWTSPS
jgi:hypothetical protein